MIKPFRKVYPVYILVDIILILASFYASYYLVYNGLSPAGPLHLPNMREYSFTFLLWALFIIFFFKNTELYTTDRSLSISRELFKVSINTFYSSIIIGSVIFFAQYKFFSRLLFLESFVLLCVLLGGWRTIKRLILRRLIARGFHNINVLIVGAGKVGKVVLEEIRKNPSWGFRAVGFLDDNVREPVKGIPISGTLKDFPVVSSKQFIDEVIITIPSERRAISELIKQAKNLRLGIRVIPENFEEPLPLLSISYLGMIPLFTYKERKRHPALLALKRIFDFVSALMFLFVLSPIFIITAGLIKLDSPGSVFYIQQRVGLKGKIFSLYKFRSMVHHADRMKTRLLGKNDVKDGVIFKIKEDPRVTRVGRFLRKYSLDELPQLINVLKGDMSLIGPRPFLVDESERFNHVHVARLNIRPGITGLAQVRGRSDLSFYRWVKWDLWYINNWSFGLDLRILWWTIPVVYKGKGAY